MATAAHNKLSEKEREQIMEQARKELPALTRRSRRAIANLRRIANGRSAS
jgi:hypothetical protein